MMKLKQKTKNEKQKNSPPVPACRTGRSKQGFTLIETMIAISLLMLAVIEPMSLTAQALRSAYYSRDQITASNLAQEAIESVRAVRDKQLLIIAYTDPNADIFGTIPVNQDFTIDTANSNAIALCNGPCPPLQTNGVLYGYSAGWANTGFTRTVHASYVAGTTDEIRLLVTVTWRTGSYPTRTLSLTENLYRWVP